MTYRVTDNRIGALVLFETEDGRECYAWILANCTAFRLYRDNVNVASGFVWRWGLSVQTAFPSIASLFEDPDDA